MTAGPPRGEVVLHLLGGALPDEVTAGECLVHREALTAIREWRDSHPTLGQRAHHRRSGHAGQLP